MDAEEILMKVREVVAEHYRQQSSPLLLSELGERLRKQSIWSPNNEGIRMPLRQFIQAAHDPNLCIVHDPNSPAYVAVTTEAAKPIVEKWIERRGRTTTTVPDLDALPRSVVLAFCLHINSGERVFLQRFPPFKFEVRPSDAPAPEHSVEIDERYRRPGLRLTDRLSAPDRLDLQTKIATWSRDKNVPIESLLPSNGEASRQCT